MRKSLAVLLLLTLACAHGTNVPPRFDDPDEAASFFNAKRGIGADTDANALYASARDQMQGLQRYSTAQDRVLPEPGSRLQELDEQTGSVGSWTFLGPGNHAGRTRALYVDPNNPQLMYSAGVSGGVWKTINGGASWTPISDVLQNIAVNSLAVHPNDPETIFAGTGEGYFREEIRGTAVPIRGNGIFVTRNGGRSWTQLASTNNSDFHWVNDLIISTHDPNRIYAATRTGVWRSTNFGESWTRVVPTTVKGGCTDLAFRGDTDGDYLFAACGVLEQATVYRSKNAEGNAAWTSVLSEPGMSRTTLAIAPSNPSIIYALAASNLPGPQNTTQNMQAVYRSTANGDSGTWSARVRANDADKLATLILTNPIAAMSPQCALTQGIGNYVPMGWHCNVIAVDPVNPDRVWAAGVDLFRSDDGGATWGTASYWWAEDHQWTYVHADQHVILFHPDYNGTTNQTLFAANDGGVFRTDNANARTAKGTEICQVVNSEVRWTSLNNGIGTVQFYHGTVFPDGQRFMGGAQDNGTLMGNIVDGPSAWTWIWGGDGSYSAINPSNPSVMYTQSQVGALVKSTDGGLVFKNSGVGNNRDQFLFITPMVLDPNMHDRLWTGGRRAWRSDNAASSWNAASTDVNGQISAVAVMPGDSNRVIVGTNSGYIYRTDSATTANETTAWPSTRPRVGFVSSITFHPTESGTVYATYAGFGGGAHVWRSTNGGATWSALDGAAGGQIPDIPVHSMAIDPTRPNRIWLGTDLGIFVTTDGGAHWMIENGGFTAAITEWVTIGQGSYGPAIYAFTHGRGAWRAELNPAPRRRGVRDR